MPDFLPRRDLELLRWSANFDAKIHSDFEAFGLSAADAAEYRTAHLAFEAAMQTVASPTTRTPSALFAKDTARAAVAAVARRLASVARGMQSADGATRMLLRLKDPVGGRRTRTPPPTTAPSVHVASRDGTVVRVTLTDPSNPIRKAWPTGVRGAAVFTAIGETQPESGWRFTVLASRTTVDVPFSPELPPGTKVWIAAHWLSPTHVPGPTSAPCCTCIAGGSVHVSGL